MIINVKPILLSISQLYAPTANCTEEELNIFYEELDGARELCKANELIIVMGNLNAK